MSKEHKNGNGNGNGYPPEVWEKVEQDYAFSPLSVAAISRNYGISRPAIEKHMKALGISRQRSADIKNAVGHKLLEGTIGQQVTADNYDAAIDQYGEVGAGVIGAHRILFTKILQQLGVTIDELTANQGVIDKLANGERIRKNILMAAKLALANRDKTLRTVAYVMDKIVPLQRQAFGLDAESGTTEAITYIIVGDLKKPPDAGMGSAKKALIPG